MSALICGSLAYDTIMVFPERFKDHILPDKVHILSVAFLVPEMRREFGGVAGNISYNLKMLGAEPFPMATVGDDFDPYRQRFSDLGISLQYVTQIEGQYTPQAFITTDLDDNQIAAFHPGAMAYSYRNQVKDTEGIRLGLVGPDGKEAMLQHSEQFADRGVPHIFDPGQGMTLFNGDELKHLVDLARWVIVNDYESQLLEERTGFSSQQIAQQVDAYIVTMGADGSVIHTREDQTRVSTPKVSKVVDPTGCGDAYRAGLIYGLLNDMDLATACSIGSLLGAIKIRHMGPQNHRIALDEFQDRFQHNFGYRF